MTGAALAPVRPITTGRGRAAEKAAWAAWLTEQLDPAWRPGEWDERRWMFTAEPANAKTSIWRCATAACEQLARYRGGRCTVCADHLRASGLDVEEFTATFVPPQVRDMGQQQPCLVERDEVRCERPQQGQGLCRAHHARWRTHRLKALPEAATVGRWVQAGLARPYPTLGLCRVGGCGLQQDSSSGLCRLHVRRWLDYRRYNQDADLAGWAAAELPHLGTGQFTLLGLAPVARLELLFALQRRDATPVGITPWAMRTVTGVLADTVSIAFGADPVCASGATVSTLLRVLVREVRRGFERFRGVDPMDKTVWDLSEIGLKSRHRDGAVRHRVEVDLGAIDQVWLREAFKAWVRVCGPDSQLFRLHLKACLVASAALGTRPGGGADPARLSLADMDVIAEAFGALVSTKTGGPVAAHYRSSVFTAWFTVLDFGRKTGQLEQLPGGFTRHDHHRIRSEHRNEEEIGKAIPESVIRQLDAHLHRLGVTCTRGDLSLTDGALMMQTVYLVLRDTGRRPLEVASLDLECIERIDGDHNLIWHNHKSRRLRRRLPITPATAALITRWQQRRRELGVPARSAGYLFPSLIGESGKGHITTSVISFTLRQWVDGIPALYSEQSGTDGTPLPFDRSAVFPYAFRHSFAQRHADAGTDIDVLRQLMDHKTLTTTAGYYQVSLKRKREAVDKLRLHVVDHMGRAAPMASAAAYQARSVAVPFGNCIEPQNVKAGGKGCRIRFQCAGCGFYRPDPSYLSAIEEHINSLAADRETAQAMDAAEFVIRNLSDQIEAFKAVAVTMHAGLDALPADQRAQIEAASAVMRKARAGERALLPLSVVSRDIGQVGQ